MIILAIIAVPTITTIFYTAEPPPGETLDLKVTAHQWWWEFEYLTREELEAEEADLEDVLPKLKEEGCRAGGDALIMQSSDTFSQGRDGIRTQRISATVIRWKTE